jgi:hypothetical protein
MTITLTPIAPTATKPAGYQYTATGYTAHIPMITPYPIAMENGFPVADIPIKQNGGNVPASMTRYVTRRMDIVAHHHHPFNTDEVLVTVEATYTLNGVKKRDYKSMVLNLVTGVGTDVPTPEYIKKRVPRTVV